MPRLFRWTVAATLGLFTLFLSAKAHAQHLVWDLGGQHDATSLYGEVTVLATAPSIYYCAANWHPGEPAGGYCGIQHNTPTERRTIFSIWDTTALLHPKITAADPQTQLHRFGGEGEGGHTHMIWPWNTGETWQFYLHKQPGKTGTTDTRYYVYDRVRQVWIHSATINSPDGGKPSVATIGGGLSSFLENFAKKKDRDDTTPKLALYRLWLGSSVDTLKPLTKASGYAMGAGVWGQMHDEYFLAEGDPAQLKTTFAKLQKQWGAPTIGEKGKKLPLLSDKPLAKSLTEALKQLPQAPAVTQ